MFPFIAEVSPEEFLGMASPFCRFIFSSRDLAISARAKSCSTEDGFASCRTHEAPHGCVEVLSGLGGILGGVLGGWLGDRFHRCWPYRGRCLVAQLSVLLGCGLFLAAAWPGWWRFLSGAQWGATAEVMTSPVNFSLVVAFFFAFHFASCWTDSSAARFVPHPNIARACQDAGCCSEAHLWRDCSR